MNTQNIILAFLLTIIAGLSTGIGGWIALILKRINTKVLCYVLGLSAGVMLYVSFMDMLPVAKDELIKEFGFQRGSFYLVLALFGGMALVAMIDMLIPKSDNPHEIHDLGMEDNSKSLHRSGLLIAVSIALHNFPEGIATFFSALEDLEIALPISFAIALHNIPEGIAVSVPIFYATGSRKKAFVYSLLSGLAEPCGAFLAYIILAPYWNAACNGIMLASVSGVMIYVSLDELLPSAEKYGRHHIALSGILSGMILIAFSTILL